MPITPSIDSAQMSDAIDLEVLRSFDDPDSPVEESLMIELIDLYLVETSRLLEVLRQGIEGSNLDDVTMKAHSLKGSSSNLGVLRMASISERLEHFRSGGATRLELLAEMEEEFARVSAILGDERRRRLDENTDR